MQNLYSMISITFKYTAFNHYNSDNILQLERQRFDFTNSFQNVRPV